MRVKTITDEDFVNYKVPTMFIGTVSCSGKCCIEQGLPFSICQNDEWRKSATIEIDDHVLCERYIANPITKAVLFGGLEPIDQIDELVKFLCVLRQEYKCMDDVVIYTGYEPDEIHSQLNILSQFPNIVIKFGRYIPHNNPHFDEVLGVNLASDNQYAVRFS